MDKLFVNVTGYAIHHKNPPHPFPPLASMYVYQNAQANEDPAHLYCTPYHDYIFIQIIIKKEILTTAFFFPFKIIMFAMTDPFLTNTVLVKK